jgi:hypothetical protein
MSSFESVSSDDIRDFREDLLHRDDADPNVSPSQSRELSDQELSGIVPGIDPREAHDKARQLFGIDYPGTELDPDFTPPKHPLGY